MPSKTLLETSTASGLVYSNGRRRSLETSSSQHSTFSAGCRVKPKPISPVQTEEQRSVTFEPHIQVYSTIHHSEYSPEERAKSWLNEADLDELKSERKACLRIMERFNAVVDDDLYYFRGLESKTMEGFKRKRFNFVDACMAVLDEQSDQSDCGITDQNAIAKAYAASCQSSVERARQRGIFDEAAASSASISLSWFGF